MKKIPYLITCVTSMKKCEELENKLDNRTLNPLVFLANEGIEDGIDEEIVAEIDDYNIIAFINPDYIERIEKFFMEIGCKIKINIIDDYLLNNQFKFIKIDDGFNKKFIEYYSTRVSFDDIFNKIADNGFESLNQYDKMILENKKP